MVSPPSPVSCDLLALGRKIFISLLPKYIFKRRKGNLARGDTLTMVLRFKYALTKAGESRCVRSEFYLQETPTYKGYTEKIFRSLHGSRTALTVREISEVTGIRTRSVNGVITFNIYAGYIRRIFV